MDIQTQMKSIIIFCLLLTANKVLCQTKDDKLRLDILKKNVIGKEFHLKKENETIKYLGVIISGSSSYKILNTIWVWGKARHATSRIYVYNMQNNYLGNYNVNSPSNLPASINNNELQFLNNAKDCETHRSTLVSFKNGPPKVIFLKCDGSETVFEKI